MQKNVTILALGRGFYRCRNFKDEQRTRERGHTEIQKNGTDTNGMTTILYGFHLKQHRERRVNIQLRIFLYIFRFSPVFPCTGTREKIYRKTLEQKSRYWDSFFLMQREKDKGSQKRQCNSNSSPSTTKATAIRSVSTD